MVIEDQTIDNRQGGVRGRTASDTLAVVGGVLILIGVPIGLLFQLRLLAPISFVVCGVVTEGVLGTLAILMGARANRGPREGNWLFLFGLIAVPVGVLSYLFSYAMILVVSGGLLLIAAGALVNATRMR